MKANRNHIILAVVLFAQILGAKDNYTGFHVAALPNVSYKDGEGFAAGGNIFFFQYGDGQTNPYRWNSTLSFKTSTKGTMSSYLFIDVPHMMGDGSRFNIYVEYKQYLMDDYYSLGNNPDYNLDYLDPNNAQYRDKLYYSFKQRWPGMVISAQVPSFIPHTQHIFSLGYYNRQLASYPLPNRLQEEKPTGFNGGIASLLQYGLVYDTRDQETAPQSGVWSDFLVEYAAPLLGSTHEYVRFTLTDRRYYLIFPRVVYTHRLIVEPILGNVPFYDMAVINGSYRRNLGLGGSSSMRGIPRLLFVGQYKALGNFELRFETWNTTIYKQDLTFYIHTFADFGRVWMKNDPIMLDNIHNSYGAGLHIRWKRDLIGAIDFGRSKFSNLAVYITFRNLF